MNSQIEAKIAQMRCENRPVKVIAKRLGLNREDIELVIQKWILSTDPFIEEIIKGRKVKNPKVDPSLKVNFVSNVEELLKDDDVLDYIALHWTDHHDRLMDCIRYKIYVYLKTKEG
ncbi:hypothetical protein [Stygiolobus caldivivus]|uniref:Uncharacterized protein n=1 Tax=Stygiolobus caldivivus TaxID=2824673 RepID=A0A8D5U9N4_9CREN|nr:hypothetical protein [Stygiolobus caldivivus]BCU71229.1 hypothetical protein KN1_25260 [Stygiolobus caldivivus]